LHEVPQNANLTQVVEWL